MLRFWVGQAILSLLAAFLLPSELFGNAVFNGVVGAQASLLGIWFAFGTARAPLRQAAIFAGLGWLAMVMSMRPHFNSWDFALHVLRTVAVGLMFLVVRSFTECALRKSADSEAGLPVRVRVHHLLGLMLAIGLGLALLRGAMETDLGLYAFVVAVAVGFASISVVACWGVFGIGNGLSRAFLTAVFLLLIIGALAVTAYVQSSRLAAGAWTLGAVAEAAFAIASLMVLRSLGYRIY